MLGAFAKDWASRRVKSRSRVAFRNSLARRGDDIRRIVAHFRQQRSHLEHEHAGIPVEAAGSHHLLCLVQGRLFDEALHGLCACRKVLAAFDIAVAGCRFGRLDAEGHELAAGGRFARGADAVEIALIGDDLIVRAKHMHDHVLAEKVGDEGGSGGNGGCGVAGNRLQQDRLQRVIEFAGLFGHEEAEFLIGQHDRWLRRGPDRRRGRAFPETASCRR